VASNELNGCDIHEQQHATHPDDMSKRDVDPLARRKLGGSISEKPRNAEPSTTPSMVAERVGSSALRNSVLMEPPTAARSAALRPAVKMAIEPAMNANPLLRWISACITISLRPRYPE
jgi:hypothetical protein